MTEKWHRHFGVYGVCYRPLSQQILVIKKTMGPYQGRYDLPGGSLEPNESLRDALLREFKEETGLTVDISKHLGVYDFLIPFSFKESTHTHHIALMFQVTVEGSDEPTCPMSSVVPNGKQNDSAGQLWIDISTLDAGACSPLLIKALEVLSGKVVGYELTNLPDWNIFKGC